MRERTKKLERECVYQNSERTNKKIIFLALPINCVSIIVLRVLLIVKNFESLLRLMWGDFWLVR